MARVLQITMSSPTSAPVGRRERIGDVTLAEALFVCGIMLLPYDAFPVFPSTYRPVAIIPLGLSLLLCLADGSLPGRPSRAHQRILPVCTCVRGDSEERRRHPHALGRVRLHEGVCRAWDFWRRALLRLLPAMRGRDSRAWGQGAVEMHDNRLYVHLFHVHAALIRELRIRPVLACSCAACCAWPLECFRAAARSRGGDRA